MDNGFVFIIGLFAFFFVLWFMGGGPAKQISHQGIYITPALTTGATQSGYGPKPGINVTIGTPKTGSVSVQSPSGKSTTGTAAATQPAIPSVSIIRSTEPSAANPDQHYIEFAVTTHMSSEIDLKGWKFSSENLRSSAEISADTFLAAGKTILVVTSFPVNASHDTMQLVDTDGSVVATANY